MHEIYINLVEDDIRYCLDLAQKRHDYNVKIGRKPANDAPTDPLAALTIEQQGVFAEYVVYRFLEPVTWHRFIEGSVQGLPDFYNFIDAKWRPRHDSNLIIQGNDPAHWAYVHVSAELHPVYVIRWWIWGDHAKACDENGRALYWKNRTGKRRPAFFVPGYDRNVRDPLDLKAELRRRQQVDGHV